VILSVNRFIRPISNEWAGRVFQRYGIFRPFSGALLGGVLTTTGYAFAPGFWPLLVLRVIWGICFSFLRLGGYLTALEEGKTGARGRLMGVYNTGYRAGQVVGALLGALLADALGYRDTFWLLGGLTAFFFVTTLIGWGRQPAAAPASPQGAWGNTQTASYASVFKTLAWNTLIAPLPAMARHLRYRLLSVNLSRFALGLGVEGLLVATLGYILRTLFGSSVNLGFIEPKVTTLTGVLLAVYWSSDLGLSTFLGHVSDRLGRGTLLKWALPTLVIGLIIVGFVKHVTFLLLLPPVFVATTASSVVLDALAGDMAPPGLASRVMSRYATWRDLGSALGPLLGYGVGAAVGFSWIYLLSAILLLAAGLLYLYSVKMKRMGVKVVDRQ
jgi:MFS family permease